ncbi:erythromycin esterase family protein [Alkalihalobacillus sp. LMS39]|uniref:erythromycin esterase family protein n=1 Tax=Alkalihalobacillus sp. LMS39 TaxID=2924032 RepID=UPI001FB44326|nr:erythromycin esterase family protein [Alkalihalobacillus sp. LMS39]UOE95766.1 erythromycin esterase family protein [Alkalihalobacillus sp. LMS39]
MKKSEIQKRQTCVNEVRQIAQPIEHYHKWIDDYVANKKIVLLGENSHFIGDYYEKKIELIKYLHIHHGFSTVVLESGLLEASMSSIINDDVPIKKRIKHDFLGIYHNEEMLSLFTDPSLASLTITGMDVQPTDSIASQKLVNWVGDHLGSEWKTKLEQIETLFFEFDRQIQNQFKISKKIRGNLKDVIEKYNSVIRDLHSALQKETDTQLRKRLEILLRGMKNRQQWFTLNVKGRIASSRLRDEWMFENLEWILQQEKDKKIIVWSHNFHIRKRKSLLLKIIGMETLGHLLTKHYPNDTYTIGLYARSGSCYNAYKEQYELSTSNPRYLESLIAEATDEEVFLPLTLQTKKQQSWMKQHWWLLESKFPGMGPHPMKPQRFYDGLLVFGEVQPPTYYQVHE